MTDDRARQRLRRKRALARKVGLAMDGLVTLQTSEHFVAAQEARLTAKDSPPWWEIRKGWDGYYVVPPAPLGQGRWGVDVGYESLGNYVARVARAYSRLCPRCLGNDPPGVLREDDCTCREDTR